MVFSSVPPEPRLGSDTGSSFWLKSSAWLRLLEFFQNQVFWEQDKTDQTFFSVMVIEGQGSSYSKRPNMYRSYKIVKLSTYLYSIQKKFMLELGSALLTKKLGSPYLKLGLGATIYTCNKYF